MSDNQFFNIFSDKNQLIILQKMIMNICIFETLTYL